MKKLFAILAASTLFLTSCGGSETKVANLSVADFAAKITDTSVTILDVRTPAEFMTGHIAGAINIDFQSTQFASEIANLDKTKTYAVYCRSGNRSAQATDQMAKAGFTSLFNLNGGIIDWQSAGQGLVTQ